MSPQDLKSLKVDKTRLMDTLHHTCAFGTGVRSFKDHGSGLGFTPMDIIYQSLQQLDHRQMHVVIVSQ